MSITPLPTPAPNYLTQTPEDFSASTLALAAALPTLVAEMNALGAAMAALAAGGAMTIPYTFSTATADADPGDGYLRLDNATQNLATTIRADLVGADGSTWTDLLDTFDDSTSAVKGFILLQAVSDATKWLIFSVSVIASPAGYRNITVASVASSAASPFADGTSIVLKFSRNGDSGAVGNIDETISQTTIPASALAVATTLPTGYEQLTVHLNGLYGTAVDTIRTYANSTAAGPIWDWVGLEVSLNPNSASLGCSFAPAVTGIARNNQAFGQFENVNMGTSQMGAFDATITLKGTSASTFQRFHAHAAGLPEKSTAISGMHRYDSVELDGIVKSTAQMTALVLQPNAGTFQGGTITLKGRKHA